MAKSAKAAGKTPKNLPSKPSLIIMIGHAMPKGMKPPRKRK
jgi:hypothetical protein